MLSYVGEQWETKDGHNVLFRESWPLLVRGVTGCTAGLLAPIFSTLTITAGCQKKVFRNFDNLALESKCFREIVKKNFDNFHLAV